MNPCPVHDERTATVFLFFIAVRGRTPRPRRSPQERRAPLLRDQPWDAGAVGAARGPHGGGGGQR